MADETTPALARRATAAATGARLDTVPTQRPAPEPRGGTRRGPLVALVAGVVVLGLGGVAWGGVDSVRTARAARSAAVLRVDDVVGAQALDLTVARVTRQEVAIAAAARTATQRSTTAAADAAAAVLAASPHAGDVPRAELQAAVDVSRAAAASAVVSPRSLALAAAALVGPHDRVVAAEGAWQAAEAARIAAEQAAREAAARASAVRSTRAPSSAGTRVRSGSTPASSAPVPVARTSSVPAGGLVCTSPGSGATQSSAGEIGAAINAYRASLGLPALAVSGSGSLGSHAESMANAGGIWHSGGDNIVGCVSGSPSSLVKAWSRSSGHDEQMRRTNVSSMVVGGAVRGGVLYGAVAFR